VTDLSGRDSTSPVSSKPSPLRLLAIIELGGYPNFSPLYRRLGFEVEQVSSQRKALSALKRQLPDVIVAEYNFQSDFRDRTSNLETLMARVQRHPQVRVIAIHQPDHRHKLETMLERFPLFATLPLPVTEAQMEAGLRRALADLDQGAASTR
jgi:DNA-binding NtrC family response regulator